MNQCPFKEISCRAIGIGVVGISNIFSLHTYFWKYIKILNSVRKLQRYGTLISNN